MDAKEFLTTVIRECQKNKSCKMCPFYEKLCIHYSYFDYFTEERENEIIAIAEKLNHKKTYAEDFLERFPNVLKSDGHKGVPLEICRGSVYNGSRKEANCWEKTCDECWNEQMPEGEK